MKKLFVWAALAAMVFSSCAKKVSTDGYGYTIKDNQIVYNTPARPADQQSMLGFAADPIEHVRIGLVGLGDRGTGAVRRLPFVDDATIVALCDLLPERVERAQGILEELGAPRALYEFSGEEGYKQLCERDDIDLVYLAVPWQLHTPIAVYAMEHGKHVAIEVPAATSIKECWDLVNTSERTRRHCMMLENCCYDFFELTCLNMIQQGVFGEVVHVEGSYCHNLEPYWDQYQGDWRMTYNKDHHGDVYPTHGIGPICQDIDIHRGDKMDILVSMDTDAFAGQEIADKRYGKGAVEKYANGDNTMTFIRTRKGKTILVEHNTVTPRPYNRMYQVTGTKGFANKYPNEGLALGSDMVKMPTAYDDLDAEEYMSDAERDAVMEQYKHPILKELEEKARQVGGHGGMDFIMDYRIMYCLNNGLPQDMDVYDLAEWCCVTELSRISLENGCAPVEVPDFTRGGWNKVDGFSYAFAK
jgi:predicted dehydrogenase